ncbi:type IX secretion/gliding motility protein PorT/SprT [Mucilaginibacter arboris]|uniref:Outer membrane beta-barrel protein n=1 Tax=Mucilaginibacter arboris TaxID=2682090 RepID=A0A7K1SUI3_9SPHI|nr:outer membrane beta-barrel protein [Mucilaginibacter arboris]MVN20927.1 outer membrane beta-barrel protein [Mucilaginibacter arboris]
MICRYILFLALFFLSLTVSAQRVVQAWAGGADQNNFSFGYTFQYVNSSYKILKKPNWRTPYYDQGTNHYVTDSLSGISSPGTGGFALGFLARYSVTDNLEIRTVPTLVFADRAINYQYQTQDLAPDKQMIVSTTQAEFPLELKLKSNRIGNFRAYIIGGAKYAFGIGNQGKQNEADLAPLERKLKNVRNFSSYVAGFGCDIYLEYFKLSPEIKLSNSFSSVLYPESNPYASPLEKLYLHNIVFSLIFE